MAQTNACESTREKEGIIEGTMKAIEAEINALELNIDDLGREFSPIIRNPLAGKEVEEVMQSICSLGDELGKFVYRLHRLNGNIRDIINRSEL